MNNKTPTPNPGSHEALEQGCECPVLDNGFGNEELGNIRGFWVSAECKLHGLNVSTNENSFKLLGVKD